MSVEVSLPSVHNEGVHDGLVMDTLHHLVQHVDHVDVVGSQKEVVAERLGRREVSKLGEVLLAQGRPVEHPRKSENILKINVRFLTISYR